MSGSWAKLSLSILILGAIMACRELAGTSSETVSGTTAHVYLPDGKPVPYAKVSAFGVSDTSREAKHVVYSDKAGAYSLQGAPDGVYNIWIEKDSLVAFKDSVRLSPLAPDAARDTLRPGMSFEGRVGLEPNHNPQTVFVQLVGTAKHTSNSNVAPDGKFTLSGLAAGSYSLLLTSTEANYTRTSFDVELKKDGSQEPSAADTLRMIYTGIPVVRGLGGRYDSAAGAAVISWNKILYRDFAEYVIFLDSMPAKVYNNEPFATTTDTLFVDSMPRVIDSSFPGAPGGGYPNAKQFRYRVAVRNDSWATGESYKSVDIRVPAPRTGYAAATFAYLDMHTGEPIRQLKQGDTIRIAADVRSPVKIKSLTWFAARPGVVAGDSLLASKVFPSPELAQNDTILLVLSSRWFSADSAFLKLQITDEPGNRKMIHHVLHAKSAVPAVDTSVTLVASFRFSGNLRDSSPHGNNGVAHGGGFVADRFGNANSAYGFDGTGVNDYVEVPNPINLPSGDVPKSLAGWMLLGPKAAVGKTFYDCDLGGFGSPSYGSNFSFGVNGGYNRLTVWGWGDVADWHSDILPQPYVEPVWHHYAVTYDGRRTAIYIDGVEKDATEAFRWNTIPERIVLGNFIHREGHEIEGFIDDIAIFKGCLSAAAVRKLAEDR